MDWLKERGNQERLKGLAGDLARQIAPEGVREPLTQWLGADASGSAEPAESAETAPGKTSAAPSDGVQPTADQVDVGQVLIGALAAAIGDGPAADLLREIGLSGADQALSPEQLAALVGRLQQTHPEVLAQAIAVLRDHPEAVRGLLAHAAVPDLVRDAVGRLLGGSDR